MARKEVKGPITDNALNNINHNFIELYNEFVSAGMNAQEALNKVNQMVGIADNALKVAKQSDSKSDDTQKQLDDIILKDGNDIAEVVQARGGEPLLKDRLNKTDSKLADIIQDINISVTVGGSGDYETINESLSFLSRKTLKYEMNIKAEIKLLSGFIMAEQVAVDGQDLGWIKITSEDEVVTIDRSSLTERTANFPSYDGNTLSITGYDAFCAKNGGTLPQIACLFEMNETGDRPSRNGINVINGSKAVVHNGCGIMNAGGTGANVIQGSLLIANGAVFSGAKGTGISVFRNSRVAFRGADVSRSESHGIYMDSASQMDAQGVIVDDVANHGAYVDGASMIAMPYAQLNNGGQIGIYALNGSVVDAHRAKIKNPESFAVRCISSNVSVSNAEIERSGNNAIMVSNGVVTCSDASINDTTGYAIRALQGSLVYGNDVKVEGVTENVFDADMASLLAVANAVVDNASKSVITAYNASNVAANNIKINGAGSAGVRCSGSTVSVRNAEITDTYSDGINCTSNGNVDAEGATITGSGNRSIYALFGGRVNARNANARKGSSDSNDDLRVAYGGTITAHNATGGNAGSVNQVSANGIIWR